MSNLKEIKRRKIIETELSVREKELRKNYGALANKSIKELIDGARVEVESYKKNPGDFVLWKPIFVYIIFFK